MVAVVSRGQGSFPLFLCHFPLLFIMFLPVQPTLHSQSTKLIRQPQGSVGFGESGAPRHRRGFQASRTPRILVTPTGIHDFQYPQSWILCTG